MFIMSVCQKSPSLRFSYSEGTPVWYGKAHLYHLYDMERMYAMKQRRR